MYFERHRLISDDDDNGYEVGVRVGKRFKFFTFSENGFIFGNDVIMGLGIRPGKDGLKPGLRLVILLKISGNELNGGMQGTDDTEVVFNVDIEFEFVDGKHGRREVFEALEEVKRLIKILVRNWSLLMDAFWLVSEPESNVLFDDILNTLGFNSDSGLLVVDVGIGFESRGTIEVVFNLAWIIEFNDGNGGNEEVWLDNKFLINSFINSGL